MYQRVPSSAMTDQSATHGPVIGRGRIFQRRTPFARRRILRRSRGRPPLPTVSRSPAPLGRSPASEDGRSTLPVPHRTRPDGRVAAAAAPRLLDAASATADLPTSVRPRSRGGVAAPSRRGRFRPAAAAVPRPVPGGRKRQKKGPRRAKRPPGGRRAGRAPERLAARARRRREVHGDALAERVVERALLRGFEVGAGRARRERPGGPAEHLFLEEMLRRHAAELRRRVGGRVALASEGGAAAFAERDEALVRGALVHRERSHRSITGGAWSCEPTSPRRWTSNALSAA